MFDIMKAAVQETATLELTDASGEPLIGDKGKRCSITVYGPGSEAFAQAVAARENRLIERAQKAGKKLRLSSEEQRADQAEFLASVTVSFDNFSAADGSLTGKELFKSVYAERKVGFVTDQVQAFVGDWGNFTGGSAKN